MTQEEEIARGLLRSDGAVLARTTGKHEVWALSNGITFPLPASGRRSSPRLWRNMLSKLKNALAGREYRQGRICAPDGTPNHLAQTAVLETDDELDMKLDEEERRMEAGVIQALGLKHEVTVKKVLVEDASGVVKLGPHQITGLLKLADVDIPDGAEILPDIDAQGYVVISWNKKTEREVS
jgi:hypothetical protein